MKSGTIVDSFVRTEIIVIVPRLTAIKPSTPVYVGSPGKGDAMHPAESTTESSLTQPRSISSPVILGGDSSGGTNIILPPLAPPFMPSRAPDEMTDLASREATLSLKGPAGRIEEHMDALPTLVAAATPDMLEHIVSSSSQPVAVERDPSLGREYEQGWGEEMTHIKTNVRADDDSVVCPTDYHTPVPMPRARAAGATGITASNSLSTRTSGQFSEVGLYSSAQEHHVDAMEGDLEAGLPIPSPTDDTLETV